MHMPEVWERTGLTKGIATRSIIYSRWDEAALKDVKKTFRIYERCDDYFVIDPADGNWKLKYSLVLPLAPKPELPYFG